MTTVLITGSTDGIGLRTAQVLAAQGVDVIVHGRSQERVEAAVASIGDRAVAGLVADLSDLDQVPELAGAASAADVLINNAGVYERERVTNADGEEIMWTVNHMAPSLLTALLLPTMPERGRVIFLSSTAHGRGKFDLDDPGYAERRYNHFRAHMTTKLANLLMAREWARRQDRVDFYAVHPGVIGTKLMTTGFRKDGVNIANSATIMNIPRAADGGAAFFQIVFYEQVTAGQYIEVMWLPENAAVTVDYTAAGAVAPAIPSVILVAERIA